MALYSFKGGIHPSDKKVASAVPIEKLPLPDQVVIHLGQHAGAPSQPILKTGDLVNTGQKIADKGGFVSVPIHSSITGTVKAISRCTDTMGRLTRAITIERGPEQLESWSKPIDSPLSQPNSVLIDAIVEAGIIGLGGAAFPSHVKLSPPKDRVIDTLIINGCECEPYLTADDRLMTERTEALIDGIRILKKILNVQTVLVGIEDNKAATASIVAHAADIDHDIRVCITKTRYPQGGERQLIEALTGRVVPPRPGLPMDVGVVVQNVSTCAAIYDAIYKGKPLYERVLTVAGGAVAKPKNLLVPNGTKIGVLAEACGLQTEPHKIIVGGPMMGISVPDMDTPIGKSTSGVLFLSENEAKRFAPSPCIRCGSCVDACPLHLNPSLLAISAKRKRADLFSVGRGKDCMECGCCAYGCPSRIPIVHLIRLGKTIFQ